MIIFNHFPRVDYCDLKINVLKIKTTTKLYTSHNWTKYLVSSFTKTLNKDTSDEKNHITRVCSQTELSMANVIIVGVRSKSAFNGNIQNTQAIKPHLPLDVARINLCRWMFLLQRNIKLVKKKNKFRHLRVLKLLKVTLVSKNIYRSWAKMSNISSTNYDGELEGELSKRGL